MKHLAYLMYCTVCLVVFSLPIFAQNIQNPQSSVDNVVRSTLRVDPATGGMRLQIPLNQYPGRGGATLPVVLNYSSKVWNIKFQSTLPCNGEPVTSYRPEFAKSSASGWTSTLGWFLPQEDVSLETYEGLKGKPATQGDPNLFRIMRKFVTLPDGSRHEVRKDDALHSLSDSQLGMYYAVDGSRIKFDLATGTTFLPDGSRIIGSAQYIDRNGNFMSYSSGTWTDTLGRTFGAPIPGTAPAAAGDVTYTLPGGLTYTFRWRNLIDARTDPNDPLRYPGDAASANCTLGSAQPGTLFSTLDGNNKILKGNLFNPVVLWQIALPNSTNYTFTYNVYGELDKIVYPTGGSETFTYGPWEPLGGQLDDGTYSQANRGVGSRVVSDGVNPPQVWTYAPNGFIPGVDPATDVRVVTGPDGTITKTWYYISRGTQIKYGFDDARAGMVREQRVYQVVNSSEVMLRRIINQFAMDGPQPGGYQTATRNARVTKSVQIILDTGGNALASATEFTYDADLNVTSTKQYNFVDISQTTAQTGDIGAIPNGTLIRTQETDYLTGDLNYRNRNLLSLPTATRVKDGLGNLVAQSSIAYDEVAFPLLPYGALTGWSDPGVAARGNATSSSHWLNTTGTNLTSHAQYDQCGNVRLAWDARDTSQTNPSQIEYSAVYQRAYPTLNTSPDPDGGGPLVALTTSTEYDGNTGLVTSSIDANGQQTTFSYNDPLLRLKQVIRAAGDPAARNQTTYTYDDAAKIVTVTSDLNNFQDNVLKSEIVYDALGRQVESRAYEDGTNFIATQTHYDTMGRADKMTNPFRPLQESAVWTTTVFDALGRVLTVTTPDNAVVSTSYSGNTVTVTDQAGQKRKSVTDALGRLTDVYEDPLGVNYRTTYGYDALDDLRTVTQQTQTRTFEYDSLQRLTSATNPESGTISYQYDAVNNLTQKTDARGVVSIYGYDLLNRNTTIDYSDTASINPDVTRIYDGADKGKGRLWKSYAGGIETSSTPVERLVFDSYDALGRPLVLNQSFKVNNVWKSPYQITRTYNLAGAVTSQLYPSLHLVTYNYDNAGRLADKDGLHPAFSGNLGDGAPRTYSQGISYAPAGQLKQEQFGTSVPIYNKRFYNSRQQLAEILASTTGGDSSWNRGKIINDYSLQCAGAGCNATDNNGNLRKQETYIPANDQVSSSTSWYQQYDYDSLNRLKRVHEYTGTAQLDWQQEYDYDAWGNRTLNATNTWIGNSANPPNPALNETVFDVRSLATNNRLYAPGDLDLPDIQRRMRYDAAGNLITDSYTGAGDRVYDAENRMTQAWANSQWQFYTYNADGQRTRRKINNQETWQVYGFDGELLAEYPAEGAANSPTKEYGYRSGQLLVTAEPGVSSTQNVVWTNATGVSVSGNTLTKTGGAGWNAGAVSTQTITSGDGYVEFTASETNLARFCGLGNGDSGQNYTDIEYAIQLTASDGTNGVWVFESGNLRGNFGTYSAGDKFRVAVEGGVVKYYKISGANQTLLYTSTVTPSYPLLVDTSLYSTSSTVTNAVLSNGPPVSFTNVTGVSVSGNTLTKTGAAGWNAGAVSNQTINSGDGYVEFTASETNLARFCGLGNGDSGQNYTDIEFAIQLTASDGTNGVWVFESGTLRGNFGTYVTGDKFRVAVEGGVVKYKKNGTVFYTSSITPTYPLLVDTSLYSTGSTVSNIVFSGAAAQVQWLISDHLGTPRMIIDQSGSLATVKRHDYLPFGEEVSTLGLRAPSLGYSASDGVRQKFTQKERDVETGLDYFSARYYGSIQGRFTSADPIMITEDRLVDPQQLNLYVYCRNNPLNLLDPTGETIDFKRDNNGKLTKNGEYSQKQYQDYKNFLLADPKKYADELKTLNKLENSKINYLVNVVANEIDGSHETEGRTSTDGTNVLVTIRNVGGPEGEKFTMEGRFAHEFEHARQFEDGEISFIKDAKGSWFPNPRDYDIYDEVNAFKAQLDVSPQVKDTVTLGKLRDPRNTDKDRAGILNYAGYAGRGQRVVNTAYGGAKPGELIRPAATPNGNFFGRNHP